MAHLEPDLNDQRKTKRKLHAALRIDMTPMVDLGFLLISFFIFTTTLSEPGVTNLIMPAKGEEMPLAASHALTLLLGDKDHVVAYEGRWEDALHDNKFVSSSYSVYEGIGRLVRDKQRWLDRHDQKEGRGALVLLIKPTAGSSYKNVIDALDETIINQVRKYAIDEPTVEEKTFMEKAVAQERLQ